MPDNPVARFVESLRVSQWASPGQLADLQCRLIERLVRHASTESSHYAGTLSTVLPGGRFNLDNWNAVPVLRRRDLQEKQHELRARSTPDLTGAVIKSSTSGSTGSPMEFVKSALLTAASRAVVERAHDWVDADRDLDYATISIDRTNPPAPPTGRFRNLWSWMGGRGRHGFLSIDEPLEVQIEFLDKLRPAYLKTYTTNAIALGRIAANHPWRSNLRHIFTFGEMLSDDNATEIKTLFGLEASSFYASEEAGQLATRCPHSGMYHAASEVALIEVLREDDTACEPGETGRVVVTPFYNYAMPLIRYDQGDYAQLPQAPCGCGRTLPTIGRILGRARDMFVQPNGDRVWPRMSMEETAEFLPALQRQVIQHRPDLIEIVYVDDGSGRRVDLAGLTQSLCGRYGAATTIMVTRKDEITRSPGGKFREFICLVE